MEKDSILSVSNMQANQSLDGASDTSWMEHPTHHGLFVESSNFAQ